EQLAWATYRRAPAERLDGLQPDVVARMLVDAFAFLDQRRPGRLALRVFDPTMDSHGWGCPGTVVEANVEDGPFLLTTVTEELSRLGLEVAEVIHPVVGVRRDPDGSVTALLPARQSDNRESWIHIELRRRLPGEERRRVAERLADVLDDARVATRDFPAMRRQISEVAFQTRASAGARYRADEVDETISLLDWLLDDHFVMLGYREYDIVDTPEGKAVGVRAGSGLGILSDESSSSWAVPVLLTDVPERLRSCVEAGELLVVSRTNRPSTVHRQARMIYVGVKKVGGDGEILGEYRFLGLFAQKAFAEPASTIPVLRRKLRQILEREDIVDHSFDERSLRTLFEAFPKHELFAADTDSLRRTLVQLLEIQKGSDVRLLLRHASDGGSVSALVAIPRERFNATLRKRVQQLLTERFGATSVDYHLTMGERDRALLHFVLHAGEGGLAEAAPDELEREVTALARNWTDDLQAELVRVHGEAEGRRLAQTYAGRFPAGYAETTTVHTALLDIAEIERLRGAHGGEPADRPTVAMALRPDRADRDLVRFNLYKVGAGVELSGFLPILESLGLVVVEEIPYRLEGSGDDLGELHIQDFGVRPRRGTLNVERDGARLAEAALAIWEGRAEPDKLNQLVLRAGLTWDDVVVLRTYRRYRRQVGTSFTEAYLDDALVENPDVARALVELFDARFNPDRAAVPYDVSDARRRVREGCDAVERLDTDRILRGYLGMIDATLRTNRYSGSDGDRRPYLALKLDSAAVPDMPRPVPYREVFVCSAEMEGVHLRGGPIARGGMRWSDRLEDYRTEVLGLMKAQMLKNAVIVPTGSKGGFVLKRPPGDAAALRAEVRRQYETFIRGLLDVTDNVIDGEVVPPPRVRRADGDDPYLVVAADRGTATFSDVANAISAEYGFWLGDAFASGGSRGYDHKAMGITARGAWVAVQRHFRELDIDVQSEPVTVVGIGDLSGDVFGNGLLRSEAVKLVAAFDHRDIFLDPDPDPAAAFAERRRLFELPASSWQDYDRDLLSAGGGVWSRTVKAIPLPEPVRRLLHVDAEQLSPPELIQAILRAPSDLLFAGGIGTFVKGSEESHAHVGDRANDAIRIDASQVGARVIGEGGNLAFTQRGRIQYARRGGRINIDAIDNSAGVDTSDREVNLKILLAMAEADGELDGTDRDELLAAMTDDVAARVLRDTYLQTWIVSQEVAGGPAGMEAYEALMVHLEAGGSEGVAGERQDGGAEVVAGRLDREVELLPTTAEMERRREVGAGMTRPELAVLLGYAKVDLATRLIGSNVCDRNELQRVLAGYFPQLAVERFADRLPHHRLRRELVATVVANDLVNRMGLTYASRTAAELGCTLPDVAAAYWTAREVCDADDHWRSVEALDGRVEPSLQLELKAEVDRLVDAFTRSYLRHPGGDIAETVTRDRPAFHELEKTVAASGALGRRADGARARAERYT
ncbi:MAG: NAD-glutamate dehydrogenase, partial [Euzebyales bacterium]|nr:NAD-glutamate dehydrogenase [Euzebyales bacterium]